MIEHQGKVWLAHYPENVSDNIDFDQYRSLSAFIAAQCKQYGDSVAFENFDSQITYRELDYLSERFAAYLQKNLQLKKGDRFAIMLPNILQFPIALYAALRAGLVVVTVNPLYTVPELTHQLNDAKVKAMIVMANFAKVVEDTLPMTQLEYVILTHMGDCLPGVKGSLINLYLKYIRRDIPEYHLPSAISFLEAIEESKGQKTAFSPVLCQPEEVAMLQYTGGTTGVAKGAMLTHKSILANVTQCLAWLGSSIDEGKDSVITALPLYHIFALTGCFFFMAMGCNALLITNPRDMNFFVRILLKKKFNIFMGLNTLFYGLMNQKKFSQIDFSELKLVVSGGMALQKIVADRWYELTKTTIIEGYGLTEASPVIAINPVTVSSFSGSVGLPLPATEVAIRDANGDCLPLGQVGALWVRGPQVMKGYWQRDQETHEVIDSNGWLNTGDIARIDDRGMLYLVDRAKDIIIVSGFNVFPNEIERVLMSHPDVQEAAVVGVPCEATGEAVKAFIIPLKNGLLTEEIIAYCHQHLTHYKIPKYVEFKDDLPKSNVGKVLRRALREE